MNSTSITNDAPRPSPRAARGNERHKTFRDDKREQRLSVASVKVAPEILFLETRCFPSPYATYD
jgi:hypothetical protein